MRATLMNILDYIRNITFIYKALFPSLVLNGWEKNRIEYDVAALSPVEQVVVGLLWKEN